MHTMSNLHRFLQYLWLLFATCGFWSSAQRSITESNTNLDSSYFFYQRHEYAKDCTELQSECSLSSSSGVYLIKPDGYSEPFEVYCDNSTDSGGWTVIQRRMDGSVSFNRSWKEYEEGFGFPSTEFWLGNMKLSYMTNQAVYELRIDMVLSNGSSFYIVYNAFRITDEWGLYSITSVGDYAGTESSVITYCPPNTVYRDTTCEPVQNVEVFTDCYHAYQANHSEDDVYTIRPLGWTEDPFKVSCNMSIDGGGWTVLQRRVDGSTDFYRNWTTYRNGFGDLENEFWLGNEKLHYLTSQDSQTYELRVDIVSSGLEAKHAKYPSFRVDDESTNYRIGVIGSCSGTACSGMDGITGDSFSTFDRDNDGRSSYNCAEKHRAGWWFPDYFDYTYSHCNAWYADGKYRSCADANLNGVYGGGNGQTISWADGAYCGIKYAEMKIRPVH